MSFEKKSLKEIWVFSCQTPFHTKSSKKFRSKIISLKEKIIEDILSFYVTNKTLSNILAKEIIEKIWSFERNSSKKFWVFMRQTSFQRELSKKFWTKLIFTCKMSFERRLSKKVWGFFCVKHSFKVNYISNFDQKWVFMSPFKENCHGNFD